MSESATQASQSGEWITVAPQISQALASRKPVIAFETTVLSFGLPYPTNQLVARRCHEIAEAVNCVPATLGMMDGQVCVGLSDKQIEEFCREGAEVRKVNLQNVAQALVRRELGAFTVATSIKVCAAAGIRVFATGGIGGVHRDYATTHDVSSDMVALERYPVAVVCSGVKSILDVAATLERLESLGVPIIGYRTNKFPLFHARESLYCLEAHSDDLGEIAEMLRAHWRTDGRGVLVVTPIPEANAVDPNELEDWIAGAHRAAQIGRVSGKEVTPFLLKKMEELSHGRSLTSNVALLENNALVGAQLASEMIK